MQKEVNEMFRLLVGAIQCSSKRLLTVQNYQNATYIAPKLHNVVQNQAFSTLNIQPQTILSNPRINEISNNITRSVTKYSWGKGKRKSVKAVLKRFYRLDWGGWIHTKCGRAKKMWKKHAARKRRLRQHVLCNGTQSMLLDKMVGSYWRKPKYYVEDPYEPYHMREEFMHTYKTPRPYTPKE